MPEHQLRRSDVLGLIVVVGGLCGPEVVALDPLAVLVEEEFQPSAQGVAGSNSSLRSEYHSVMRRIFLPPVGLYRIHHFWLHRHDPRGGLLRFKPDFNAAVFVRVGLSNLRVRHARNVLDAASAPVQ